MMTQRPEAAKLIAYLAPATERNGQPQVDQSFPKTHRLLNSDEFDRVFAARRSRADQRLVVYTLPNNCGHPRLGLVVSRKVGNAVTRNHWKRLLREAFRLSLHELPAVDIVCVPRRKQSPSLPSLIDSLRKLSGGKGSKA